MADVQQLRFELLIWLILTAVGTGVAAGVWFSFPALRRRLFPPQRCRAVPWTGLQILVLLLVIYFFWPPFLEDVLTRIGFFTHLYGEAPGVALVVTPEQGDAGSDEGAGAETSRLRRVRQVLWTTVFAFPLQLITILLFLWLTSGTRPYQLGLSFSRAGSNLLLGFLGWLVLAPLVNTLNTLLVWAYWAFLRLAPEEHPLTRLTREQPLAIEWGLLVLAAVLVAPLMEELLFRGIVQTWLAQRPWGGALALAGSLAMALLTRAEKLVQAAQERDPGAVLGELQPALFVLVMVPGYLWVCRGGRSAAAGAIYGTAMLFALSHAFAWPTPIPLFVLGMGVGFLAYRRQSLLGPIVLHALFNAVACVLLFSSHDSLPSRPARGNETTSAGQLPWSLTTVSDVPGS